MRPFSSSFDHRVPGLQVAPVRHSQRSDKTGRKKPDELPLPHLHTKWANAELCDETHQRPAPGQRPNDPHFPDGVNDPVLALEIQEGSYDRLPRSVDHEGRADAIVARFLGDRKVLDLGWAGLSGREKPENTNPSDAPSAVTLLR